MHSAKPNGMWQDLIESAMLRVVWPAKAQSLTGILSRTVLNVYWSITGQYGDSKVPLAKQ